MPLFVRDRRSMVQAFNVWKMTTASIHLSAGVAEVARPQHFLNFTAEPQWHGAFGLLRGFFGAVAQDTV
eukprot:m.237386 g.237386  ORF g.237386 m.237386 type:complete len:69 (+) comp26209_c0_seq3:319-525(+)